MNRNNKKDSAGIPGRVIQTVKRIVKHDCGAWILMLPCVIALLIFTYQPMVNGIYLSFCKTRAYDAIGWAGWQNYKEVLTDTVFLKAFTNGFKYVFWCLVIGFPLPVITAILLNEIKPGHKLFRSMLYVPGMIPGVVSSILWLVMLNPGQTGLFNTILAHFGVEPLGWLQDKNLVIPTIALTMTWGGYGGTVIMYLANLQSVNGSLYESATLDGAGFLAKVRYITLPYLSPILRLALVNQIIATFAIFQQVFIMTGGGPNYASTTLGMLGYQYAFQFMQTGRASALSVIQSIILIIMTTVLYKITDRGEVDE